MNDKVIVITGASSGIGEALAYQLSAQGAKLVLAARRTGELQAVAERCTDAVAVPADVTDQKSCAALIHKAVETYGRIDILVNNAATSMLAYFEDIEDLSIFEKLMRVNYLGAVYLTYAALPHLKQTKGLVVAISSLAGKTGVPLRTGYSASKHALQGFMDSLRIELKGTGIEVSVISPAFVDTSIRERSFAGDGSPLGRNPMHGKKLMSPEECAARIVEAMRRRKREMLMGTKGKLLGIGRLLMPQLVDYLARRNAEHS